MFGEHHLKVTGKRGQQKPVTSRRHFLNNECCELTAPQQKVVGRLISQHSVFIYTYTVFQLERYQTKTVFQTEIPKLGRAIVGG